MTKELVACTIVDGRLFRRLITLGKQTVAIAEIEGTSSKELIAMWNALSRMADAENDFALLISTVAKALFRQLCREDPMDKFPDNVLVELSVKNATKGGT